MNIGTIIIFIAIICFFIGVIFLTVSIACASRNKKLLSKCTSVTTAKFEKITKQKIGQSMSEPGDSTKSLFPVYKYVVNGQEYSFKGFGKAREDQINKNDIIIHYDPEDPKDHYEESKIKGEKKIFVIVFAIIGVKFLLEGILILVFFLYGRNFIEIE